MSYPIRILTIFVQNIFTMNYLSRDNALLFSNMAGKEYFLDIPLDVKVYPQACVLPYISAWKKSSGVLTAGGDYIDNTRVHESMGGSIDGIDGNSVKAHTDAIFIGSMHHIYGHCITDNIKKLWFLSTEKCKKLLEAGARIVYVSAWRETELPDFAIRILELAGVPVGQIERVSRPTVFRNVYVPDNSMQFIGGRRYWTKYFRSTIEVMKTNAKGQIETADKIYFTRTKLQSDKDFGEFRVERIFKEHGYKIVSPEVLSIDDQIVLLANCKKFACTDGSVAHGAVFCKSDADVAILLKADYVNGYQMMINNMVGFNVDYIESHHSINRRRNPWEGPFYMSVTRYLVDYLGGVAYSDLYWLRLDWFKYLYRRFPVLWFKHLRKKLRTLL